MSDKESEIHRGSARTLFTELKNTSARDFEILCAMSEAFENPSEYKSDWMKYVWILAKIKQAYQIE